jgi:hypothetical protein
LPRELCACNIDARASVAESDGLLGGALEQVLWPELDFKNKLQNIKILARG